MTNEKMLEVLGQDCQQLFASPFFTDCVMADLIKILPSIQKRHILKGTLLTKAGQKAESLYYILEGCVHNTENQSANLLKEGDFFGLAAAVGLNSYEINTVAHTDITLLVIPKESLTTLTKAYPFLEERFYQSLVASFTHSEVDFKFHQKKRPNASWVDVLGWVLALTVPVFVFFLFDHAGAQWATRNFFTVFSSAIIILGFGLTPYAIPLIAIMVAATVMGIVPVHDVFSGFESSVFYMILSIFSLGAIITRSRLFYRLALNLMYRLANRSKLLNAVCFGVGALMVLVVPGNSTRMSLMMLMLKDIIDSSDIKNDPSFAMKVIMSCFYGSTLLPGCVMTGSTAGLILYGLLPVQAREHITWMSWIIASLSYFVFITIFYSISIFIFIRKQSTLTIHKEKIALQLKLLGKLTVLEKISIFGLFLLVISIVISSISTIYLSWLVLTIFFILIALGFLTNKQFHHDIDWPFLFFLGGVLGLSNIFLQLGVTDYLYQFSSKISVLTTTPIVFLSILFWFSSLSIFITSGATFFIVAITIFLPVAGSLGISPWIVVFTILIATSLWYLPYQSTSFLILSNKEGISEYLIKKKFLLFNLLINFASYGALLLSIPYWKWLGLM